MLVRLRNSRGLSFSKGALLVASFAGSFPEVKHLVHGGGQVAWEVIGLRVDYQLTKSSASPVIGSPAPSRGTPQLPVVPRRDTVISK